MNFELPPTGTEQSPAFVTPQACHDWLATIPLANAVQAQSTFLRQLSLLHRYTLPTADRFAILEAMRGSLRDVQDDAAKKFAGKPLPLAPHEQASLDTTLNVWLEFALGYLRCFEECCNGASASATALAAQRAKLVDDPHLAAKAAMGAERTMAVFADWQIDLSRGGQVPDALYWKKLHQIFQAAEALGIAARAVSDPIRHGNVATSALASYAECCLLSTANIYELPARHLNWVARWSKRWGAKLALLTAPPEDIRKRAVPLWVDLESDRPPSYLPRLADGGRWLETTDLRKSIVARLALLEKGRAPAELQLGDDVTQPAATQLLQRILQRWCKGGATRRQERHPAATDCHLVVGLESVHFELSGRTPFRSPTRTDSALRREREEFETFGNHSNRASAADSKNDAHIEHWSVVDESTLGLRVKRPLKEGARIGAGLMVASKISDGQYFVVGNVRWALREGSDSLVAGIQLFPGEAKPVAVRFTEAGATTASVWRQGLLLPEIAALHEPASVILPAGTYRIDRIIEVMVDQQSRTLKLFRVLDRSIEFERCNFYD